jgi:hypothetical protein
MKKFLERLEEHRRQFEAGDQTVILPCVCLCMGLRIEPPEWLEAAFRDRVWKPYNFKTWNDAFGPPMPKGIKKARREEIKNGMRLVHKVQELKKRGIKGQALFERAAKEVGLKKGWEATRDFYYRTRPPWFS